MIRFTRAPSILLILSTWAASAWAVGNSPSSRVESVRATGYRVVVVFDEPQIQIGDLFGQRLAEIRLPGAAPEAPAGAPQIPSATILLRVPWGVEATVSGSPSRERTLGVYRPVPFPGLLSSPAALARVGPAELHAWLDGPEYRSLGARAPSPPLVSAFPSSAGGERVLQVRVSPLRWDPRTQELTFVDRVEIYVSWDRPVEALRPDRTGDHTAAELGPRGGTLSSAGWDAALGPAFTPRAPAPLERRSPAPRALRGASAYTGPLRVEPTRPWVRLGVLRPGLYVVSAADLAAAGVSVAGIDPATFRIFRATPGDLPESVFVDAAPDSLRECAIAVTGEGDGSFDAADRLYFYATGSTGFGYDLVLGGSINYQEPDHSDEESVWLTWGPGPSASAPRRIPARDAAPQGFPPLVTTVPHRVHYEENRIRDFNLVRPLLRWERWFYRLITQGSRIPFVLSLPGADPGGIGSMVARMWGKGISVGSIPDHVVNLYWNGALVGTASWDRTEPRDITAAGFAVHATDTLEVQVPRLTDPDDPNRFDQTDLAWFEVTYPRTLAAINDTLQFGADTTLTGVLQYRITGISDTGAVWLLDRTDPESPLRLVNGSVSGTGPFTWTVQDTIAAGPRRRYSLVSTARAARPVAIARYAPVSTAHTLPNLLDSANGVDYVIVAPSALLAPAESLAAYRSTKLPGYAAPRVAIATTERVTAQFGAGYLSPVAIRNFLAYGALHWTAPTVLYVCLFGDASLDPKNYLGFNAPDWVPTYSRYFDALGQFISDDFYGFLDGPGDNVLDLAVGRLPAKTEAEGQTLARGKLQAYENATEFDPWRARALLCADDAWKRAELDGLGNIHVEEMERKDRAHLPYPLERSKVYLNDYAFADTTHQSKPAAREDLIARINQGNWLVDYIGHGSDVVIADEQVFRSSDMGRLTNASRPSIFGFFSCTVGKFDALGLEGLGELLVKSPAGGGVASMAATELVFPDQSTELNDEMVDQLFPLSPRADTTAAVGLAWARAKNAHRNVVVRKYALLGDPGLTLPVPRGRGVWEKSPLDSLLRGQLALIEGHALNFDSTADTLSNGTAFLQIQGKPFHRVQYGLDNLNRLVPTTYSIPGPILYRGDVPLVAGRFQARFVVPVDARIASGTGQLRALLSSAGGRGVGLAVDSIRIGQGFAPRTDTQPPTISLRYPAAADSSVQPGDRLTIVIQDSSGIDLMRLDNAHTIFVILDDRGLPTELTPSFTYDRGSYTSGSVPFTVPQLAEGLHRLEVHASDVYGNIGIRTFVLDVHAPASPGDPMRLTQVFNYPNPFEGQTYIHARLNQEGRLKVQILTVAGRRIRELSTDGRAGENYIPWDGKDSEGENVAIGVYLVKVTAESQGGKRASVVARALRTR